MSIRRNHKNQQQSENAFQGEPEPQYGNLETFSHQLKPSASQHRTFGKSQYSVPPDLPMNIKIMNQKSYDRIQQNIYKLKKQIASEKRKIQYRNPNQGIPQSGKIPARSVQKL